MKVFTLVVGGGLVTFLGALFFFAALGAYPTKWLVNFLFSPAFLLSIFGVAKIGFWQALCLNILTGVFFHSSTNSK